jgi:hypothetical protein
VLPDGADGAALPDGAEVPLTFDGCDPQAQSGKQRPPLRFGFVVVGIVEEIKVVEVIQEASRVTMPIGFENIFNNDEFLSNPGRFGNDLDGIKAMMKDGDDRGPMKAVVGERHTQASVDDGPDVGEIGLVENVEGIDGGVVLPEQVGEEAGAAADVEDVVAWKQVGLALPV